MENYLPQLLLASQKSAYRKAPIITSGIVDRLAKQIEEQKQQGKLKRRVKYDESTPLRAEISEAVKKAGRKAFKEQVQLGDPKLRKLRYDLDSLMRSGAPEKEIEKARQAFENYVGTRTKYNDLMREADKYREDPIKYFTKSQEAKDVLREETESSKVKALQSLLETQTQSLSAQEAKDVLREKALQSLLETQTQSLLTQQQQNKLLELNQQILVANLKPEQLLKTDEEFSSLSKAEQTQLIKKLQAGTKQDKTGRGEAVLKYLKLKPEEKKALISIEASKIPVKVKGQVVGEEPTKKGKKQKGQRLEALINKTEIDNALSAQRYSSPEEKEFVEAYIYNDQFNSLQELNDGIETYKRRYNQQKPKKTDIYFTLANEEKAQDDLVDSAISADVSSVARDVAIADSIPRIDVPEDAPLVDKIADVLQATDELTPEEAQADAKDAVSGANAEAYLVSNPQPAQATATQEGLPEYIDFFLGGLSQESIDELIPKFKKAKLTEKEETDLAERINVAQGYRGLTETQKEREADRLMSKDPTINRAVALYTVQNPLSKSAIITDFLGQINEGSARKKPEVAEAVAGPEVVDDLSGMTKNQLKQYIIDNFDKKEKGNISSLSQPQLIAKIRRLREEGKEKPKEGGEKPKEGKKKKKTGEGFEPLSGEGFKPLLSYPAHLVAGALGKHIDRVRKNRLKTKMNAHAVLNNIDNEEYRKKITKHILRGGSINSFLSINKN